MKTGIMAIFSLYGFTKVTPCIAEDNYLANAQSVKSYHQFRGVYYGELQNGRILLPDTFSKQLLKECLVLIAPGKNCPLLLFTQSSPEWRALEQMFEEAGCECLSVLREYVHFDREGRLCLPEKVIRYAGIRTSDVTIKGRGFAIEITDSNGQA